jgi:hypothetical protein
MTPHNPSKPFLCLLLTLLALAPELTAAPITFPDHKFSIELPAAWTQVTPTPAGALTVAKNASGSTQVILIPRNLIPLGFNGQRAELKKSLVKKGIILQPDQVFKVGDQPFILVYGRYAAGNLTLADYITGTDREVITIAFTINGVPTTSDPDIDSIVRSFTFLP